MRLLAKRLMDLANYLAGLETSSRDFVFLISTYVQRGRGCANLILPKSSTLARHAVQSNHSRW